MARILTTNGEMDESALIKHEGLIDDAVEHTTTVEYCLVDCPGPAHRTGIPDAAYHFCTQHVHRSVTMQLKQPAVFADGHVGGLG
jgi:hypothetical protein